MSLSGKSSVAFIPSSRRPGFFGIAVFSRPAAAEDGAVSGAGWVASAVIAEGYDGPERSVVVRAGQEVAAAADQLALPFVHLGAAVRAGQDQRTRIVINGRQTRNDGRFRLVQ